MKIIFLDIDGVLNTTQLNDNEIDLDLDKIDILKKVVEKTNASIFLISSWSKGLIKKNNKIIPIRKETKYLLDIFNKNNIKLIDFWKLEHPKTLEIYNYLENNEIDSFVILEDEYKSFDKNLLSHTVKIDEYNGLQPSDIYKITNILKNSEKEKLYKL